MAVRKKVQMGYTSNCQSLSFYSLALLAVECSLLTFSPLFSLLLGPTYEELLSMVAAIDEELVFSASASKMVCSFYPIFLLFCLLFVVLVLMYYNSMYLVFCDCTYLYEYVCLFVGGLLLL